MGDLMFYPEISDSDQIKIAVRKGTSLQEINYPISEFKRQFLNTNDSNILWDRLFIPFSAMIPNGRQESAVPAIAKVINYRENDFSGVYGYSLGYSDPIWQDLLFNVQLPHSYKAGSDIYPVLHAHYADSGDADGSILLEMEVFAPNESGSSFYTFNYTVSDTSSIVFDIDMPTISLDTDIGNVLCFRVSRDSGWAYPNLTGLVNDSCGTELIVTGVSLIYQKDSEGSNNKLTKDFDAPRITGV